MKRYRAVIYCDVYVPEQWDSKNEKNDAEWVANQVARQIEDNINPEWKYSQRNYWIGSGYSGGVADTDNMTELINLGQNK